MPDEFSGSSDNGYDSSRFYTASRDNRGFSDTTRLRTPTGLAYRIKALVASGKTEYRTDHDFYRDAIVHRLNDVAKLVDDPEFTAYVAQVTTNAKADAYLAGVEANENLVKQADKIYESTVGHPENLPGARQMLTEIIGALPVGSYREAAQRRLDALG